MSKNIEVKKMEDDSKINYDEMDSLLNQIQKILKNCKKYQNKNGEEFLNLFGVITCYWMDISNLLIIRKLSKLWIKNIIFLDKIILASLYELNKSLNVLIKKETFDCIGYYIPESNEKIKILKKDINVLIMSVPEILDTRNQIFHFNRELNTIIKLNARIKILNIEYLMESINEKIYELMIELRKSIGLQCKKCAVLSYLPQTNRTTNLS